MPSQAPSSVIQKANKMAELAHTGQTRASGEPYIEHPKKVAEMLQTMLNADEDTVVAALLHDVIEDTSLTSDDLKKEFGIVVSTLVEGVTKVGKVEKSMSAHERNLHSIRKMIRAMGSDMRVIFIKLADRLHNMETLDNLRPEKQRRIARETLEIYCPLANLLGLRAWYEQLSDLCFIQLEKVDYELIQRKRIQVDKKNKKHLENWTSGLNEFLEQSSITNITTKLNPRHAAGIYNSLEQLYTVLDNVETFYTVKIIVPTEQDCYSVLGWVHRYASIVPKQIKDYIAVPKVNGYRAIHTKVLSGLGSPISITIQTNEMSQQSTLGEALMYVNNSNNPDAFKQLPHWAKSLVTLENEDHDLPEFYRALQSEIFGERVHVHVVNGDESFVDIPMGSSALDLAYYTDAKFGSNTNSAVINGEPKDLKHIISDGDIVEFSVGPKQIRNPQDIMITHTSLGQKRLIESLSKHSHRSKEKNGKEYISKMIDVLIDPFFSTSWRKNIFSKIETRTQEFFQVGIGDISPFDLIDWVCGPSDFFLVDSHCFTFTSHVAPDPQIRFVSSVSVDQMRRGEIIGLQTRPDVIEILPINEEDERKSSNQELVSLHVGDSILLDNPFHFALKWSFTPHSNPLNIISALQTHTNCPVELLSFNGTSATLGFHVSSLQTLRIAFEYLYAQDTITSIVRISP